MNSYELLDNLTKTKIHLLELLTKTKDLKSLVGWAILVTLATSFVMTLITFIVYLIPVLINGEYASILTVAEFAIIGSGTLAILTFTYATTNEEIETKKKIVHSGEQLFKSTLSFIIGLGLLPIVGLMFRNYPKYSNFYGRFTGILAEVYNMTSGYVTIFISAVGIGSLMLSAYFFTIGLMELINVLRETH